MNKRNLYQKLIAGYLAFGMIAAFFIATVSDEAIRSYLTKKAGNELYEEAVAVTNIFNTDKLYMSKMSNESKASIIRLSRVTGSVVWLVNPEGRIAFDSEFLRSGTLIEDFDPDMTVAYTNGTYNRVFSDEMLSTVASVTEGVNIVGYIVMHKKMSQVLKDEIEILKIVLWSAFAVYVLSFIILIVFRISVQEPLRKITEGVEEFAKGNMDYRVELVGSAEMQKLAATLNYMAKEQSDLEKYQRDFISNVSHDFRSPLTSIKGYLEAILDGTIPPELQNKYLQRVINETSRLTKLTEEMLTLGKLDSKGMLKRSKFDINRTIRDVCESTENECQKKNIGFELLFEAPEEFVYADHEKIQRVLYNLVDNAIKFSNNDSKITISTSVRQKKVCISVKDRGIGIPKDSIKKVFDRFYKSDISRGKDKRGHGIGLSIVKEIISNHNETIDVVSTEKVGTEFTFTLPQAD
ncbi:MAG: HAMP domain-containing sensor histidine kinase [Eubacteriales bacterium]|nr:HAMP domain-containing sensor histidine kinase [Eubacteriales bacterium]